MKAPAQGPSIVETAVRHITPEDPKRFSEKGKGL